MRKLTPKGILSNVSLESKDYICIQFAWNLALTYIFNLITHQLCFMQIILPKQSHYAFLFLFFLNDMNVLSPYFFYSYCAHSPRLYPSEFLIHFAGGYFQWHLFFIHPSFWFSLFCMSERIMNIICFCIVTKP